MRSELHYASLGRIAKLVSIDSIDSLEDEHSKVFKMSNL
jgi:hypothetical protein